MNRIEIINADVLAALRGLPDESVNCVVTSPPYWGLRDYGVAGQLGLEKTPEEYVGRMVEVFREVRRVLREDGTLWLNMGDCYTTCFFSHNSVRSVAQPMGDWCKEGQRLGKEDRSKRGSADSLDGLKPKDLVGMPWRLAFALQADGWWLRSDIIWAKPNPMPESVTDRPTKAHEYLFLMAKAERYYYDAEAIKESVAVSQIGRVRADAIGGTSWEGRQQHSRGSTYTKGKHSQQDRQSSGHRIVENVARARANGAAHDNPFGDTRNARSVWTIATQPYPEAHFATFPEELPARCIKAGCPAGGTVLDPFGGAGTTGLVAARLGRNAILIELNPKYAEMARDRIERECPLMAQVELNDLARKELA